MVAVSPLIGNKSFSGPADKYMEAAGIEVSVFGLAQFYADVCSKMIIDTKDKALASKIQGLDIQVLDTKIKMQNKAAGALKNLIEITSLSPKQLSELLNKEFELPLIVTSNLMHSSIGEVFILRTAEIIHPIKTKDKKVVAQSIKDRFPKWGEEAVNKHTENRLKKIS